MAEYSKSDLLVDDFYFSALLCSDENQYDQNLPISDALHAEELQLQEAIMASLITSETTSNTSSSSLTTPQENPPSNPVPQQIKVEEEIGESSETLCEICAEKKEADSMFEIENCSHSFCTDCISRHVETKVQDNARVVSCPGWECQTVLEFDTCSSVIRKDVVDKWGEMLCESLFHASQKFYCPFKDCSALLINDSDEVIMESECPVCWRLFCARCNVAWHPGVGCEEFQSMNEDERGREDLMVREMAKEKKWMRCPHCKFYVEKTQGCLHLVCRCKFEFCYACGEPYTNTHGGCQPQ